MQQNENQAIGEFIAQKAKIDIMLERLNAFSADHFGKTPEEINWGDVGTLNCYADLLTRLCDSAFHEGEHEA